MKLIRILTVDDHEMTSIGYKYILEAANIEGIEIKVDTAKTYDMAEEKIRFSSRSIPYDILLLDIQMFPAHSGETRSGEDLALLARELTPSSNIVFMSSYSDSYRINSLFKSVNPEGYMVKSEIDELTLVSMVKTVLNNMPFFIGSALSAMRRRMANDMDLIDDQDKKILHYLSLGTRTKDIAPLISAATTTVEARKRQMKKLFEIENGNDISLIEEARKRGFL